MTVVQRILGLLRPHVGVLVVAAGLAALVAGCRGALVWLVREVLDQLLAVGDSRAVWALPIAVVVLFAIQGAARAARTWLTRRAAIRAEATLRHRLFVHLLGRRPAELTGEGVGDALSRLAHDAGKIRTAMGAVVTLVQRPLSALVLLGVAASMAPRLFGWALLGLPAVALVVTWTGRRTRTSAHQHAAALGRLEALARDLLAGLRTLQAQGAEGYASARFEVANAAQVTAALQTTAYRVVGPPLVELAAAVGMAVVIALGALEVRAGTLTAGGLVAFLVALGLLNEPLKGFAVAHGLWSEARGGLIRVFEALDRQTGPQDGPLAVDLSAGPVTLRLKAVTADHGRGPVLAGLDLVLRPGTITVLRGASGAGKSTLIDAIAGFCPHGGVVAWNDTPSTGLTRASRRGAIALLEQDPWLGAGTVSDAILLGRPEATRAEVLDAARRAGLALDVGLLARLPGGIDGQVGDGGGIVSGGERQRIALARALVRKAPLLLLDEPTAHLDPATETAFLDTLRAAVGSHTVLIASHRAAPLAIADHAFMLEGGTLQVVDLAGAVAS